jgi:hypothetical protein
MYCEAECLSVDSGPERRLLSRGTLVCLLFNTSNKYYKTILYKPLSLHTVFVYRPGLSLHRFNQTLNMVICHARKLQNRSRIVPFLLNKVKKIGNAFDRIGQFSNDSRCPVLWLCHGCSDFDWDILIG